MTPAVATAKIACGRSVIMFSSPAKIIKEIDSGVILNSLLTGVIPITP